MTFSLPPLVIGAVLTALLICAAAYDIRYRRIPNWLSMSGVGIGVALNAALGGLAGGAAALALAASRKRLGTTFWNVGFILMQARSGRPAYLAKEELDVRSSKSLGLPHGAVIAVAAMGFLALSAYFAR